MVTTHNNPEIPTVTIRPTMLSARIKARCIGYRYATCALTPPRKAQSSLAVRCVSAVRVATVCSMCGRRSRRVLRTAAAPPQVSGRGPWPRLRARRRDAAGRPRPEGSCRSEGISRLGWTWAGSPDIRLPARSSSSSSPTLSEAMSAPRPSKSGTLHRGLTRPLAATAPATARRPRRWIRGRRWCNSRC